MLHKKVRINVRTFFVKHRAAARSSASFIEGAYPLKLPCVGLRPPIHHASIQLNTSNYKVFRFFSQCSLSHSRTGSS